MKRCMHTVPAVLVVALVLTACGQNIEAKWQEQYDLGVRYLSDGNYEEAIIAFTAAIEIDSKRAEAYVGRGDAYTLSWEEDNLPAALTDYEIAIEIDETLPDAWIGIATVYLRQGDYGKAMEVLDAAQEVINNQEYLNQIESMRHVRENNQDGSYFIYLYTPDGCFEVRHYSQDNVLIGYYIQEMGENGQVIKESSYDANGTMEAYAIHSYDLDGNRTHRDWYFPDGTPWYTDTYDENGNIISGNPM